MAKLANHCAKKQPQWNGVCDFTSLSETEVDAILADLPVSKVWGVGRRLEAKLNEVGVFSALRLKKADLKRIRDKFGVLLERTARELSGEIWIEMEDELPEAKQVMSSRSFGVRASTMADLSQAVAFHAGIAAERMRRKGLYANGVYVFAQNSPHDKAEYYSGQLSIDFPAPTNSTTKITKTALWLLKKLYRPGVYYQKCGVMLLETLSRGGLQSDMFGFSKSDSKSESLMDVMDRIKHKYPNNPVKSAAEGNIQEWRMQRNYLSPNYTGDWSQLLQIK